MAKAKKKSAAKASKKKNVARKKVIKKASKRAGKKAVKAAKVAVKKVVKRKSPFTKAELTAIKKTLIKKKIDILEELVLLKGDSLKKSLKDASGDLSGYMFHMADMATDLYDREFALELAEGEREIFFAIDDALKRIEEGTFGFCENCGAAIRKQRVKAMPEAKLCIKCQEDEEKAGSRA